MTLFKKFQANNDIVILIACDSQNHVDINGNTDDETHDSVNSLMDHIDRFNFEPSTLSRVFRRTPILG